MELQTPHIHLLLSIYVYVVAVYFPLIIFVYRRAEEYALNKFRNDDWTMAKAATFVKKIVLIVTLLVFATALLVTYVEF